MSVRRDDLLDYLERYLDVAGQQDFGPNGLQVEGRAEIRRLLTGVSACRALHEEAARRDCDAVLVHHGVFWNSQPALLRGWFLRRVEPLLERRINLIAYHLPLDRHPEVGNNALVARGLGLQDAWPFAPYQGRPVGVAGTLVEALSPEAFRAGCAALFGRAPLHLGGGPARIRTVGIVTGGGQGEIHQAIDAGLDAFVTGEVSEWVTHVAGEAGIHFFAAGHHATERFGVRALGEHLADRFGLEVEFCEVPNPV